MLIIIRRIVNDFQVDTLMVGLVQDALQII